VALLIPAVLLLLAVPVVIALIRINELFVLRVGAGGRAGARLVRGRAPQGLVNELADVMKRRAGDRDGAADAGGDRVVTLRAVSEDGRVRLYPSGGELSDAEKQRLRNVVAQWPVVRVRNG
jgi:hypothetical protein